MTISARNVYAAFKLLKATFIPEIFKKAIPQTARLNTNSQTFLYKHTLWILSRGFPEYHCITKNIYNLLH